MCLPPLPARPHFPLFLNGTKEMYCIAEVEFIDVDFKDLSCGMCPKKIFGFVFCSTVAAGLGFTPTRKLSIGIKYYVVLSARIKLLSAH